MRYAIVIEKAEGNFSAYVPDLPGCVATGATVEEVEAEIREAIAFHVEGLRPDGHFKFPHLWPVKFLQAGLSNYESLVVSRAMRAAASFSR